MKDDYHDLAARHSQIVNRGRLQGNDGTAGQSMAAHMLLSTAKPAGVSAADEHLHALKMEIATLRTELSELRTMVISRLARVS